jgi:hypothetical protein
MMLRWNAVLSVLFIIAPVLRAGEPLFVPHGAAEAGMAFAVTATPGHWACFNNQALMTSASGVSVSVAIETRFMMPALSSKGLSAVIANSRVPLGIIAVHYGNADYYRVMTGLGSAVSLSGGVSLGVQADYITERASGDYRDVSHLTFETGMACTLSSSVTLGVHIFNPLAALNALPSSIDAGLQWEYPEELLLTLSGSKTTSEPVSLQCGISWDVAGHLTLRSGYMTSPSSFALGLGWKTGSLKTDIGFIVNSITGITSALSFIWTIK